MSAIDTFAKHAEISDQTSRMAGLVVAFGIAIGTAGITAIGLAVF